MECMYVWVCITTKLDLWPSFWRLVNTQTMLEFSLLWFGFRWYFRRALASLLVNIGIPAPFRWLFLTVQSLSHIQLFATPWTAARQASCPSLSPRVFSNSYSLSQWCHPNHLILCHPLLLLPSIFPSIRVFSNESALGIRWPKYWSSRISASNEDSGLISQMTIQSSQTHGRRQSFMSKYGGKCLVKLCFKRTPSSWYRGFPIILDNDNDVSMIQGNADFSCGRLMYITSLILRAGLPREVIVLNP